MDVTKRTWLVKSDKGEELGPYSEDEFQSKLRAGDIPLFYQIKSNTMDDWTPILDVVTTDDSFYRPSTIPPPVPPEEK